MLIGFAGRKRSGKDSCLKYAYGQILKKNDVIDRFDINENGELVVPAQYEDGVHMGVFDVTRRDVGFVDYASQNLWPYVKDYYFASFLKEMILRMYKIKPEQLSGSTEDRMSPTPYTWEPFLDMLPKSLKPKGKKKDDPILAREFIQRYADLLRHIDPMCFIKVVMEEIDFEQVPIALVGDIRFVNEVNAIKEAGGKIIFLTRDTDGDTHASESELDTLDRSVFDAVIDNQNMSIADKNVELHRILNEWGVF